MPFIQKRRRYGKKAAIRKGRRAGIRRARKVGVRTKTFRKEVTKIIHRNEEKKEAYFPFELVPICLQSTSGGLTGNLVDLTPNTASWTIPQGVEKDERIGSSVMTRRVSLNMMFTAYKYDSVYNAIPKPMIVKLYFYRSKVAPQTSPTTGSFVGGSANFFEFDGSADQGFVGNLTDLNKKINTASYTYLCSRTLKLGFQNSSYAGADLNYESFANNDFPLMQNINIPIWKFYPKQLNWDPSNDSNITNPRLFMLIQVVAASGQTYSSIQTPLLVYGRLHYTYSDA